MINCDLMKNFVLISFLLFTSYLWSQGSVKNLDFNGSSSYVSCGSIDLSGRALTLMGWIKVDQFNSNTQSPAANISSLWGTEVSANITLLRLGDGNALAKERVQFVLYINGRPTKLNSTKSLTTNKWYHLAATFDGSTMKLYIDGKLKPQVGGVYSSDQLAEAHTALESGKTTGKLIVNW